jgi:hypothetical protein
MKPPDPCEPLEKLIDKLNEQLDCLRSQSPEQLFLEGLVDLPALTEATRTMLSDAERRLANCRRYPVPASNRPFLVTDSKCSPGIPETHRLQVRTPLWQRVVACAGLGVLGLSLGYALDEHWVAENLAAQSAQQLASLNATRSQIDTLTATLEALDARSETPLAPVADTTPGTTEAAPTVSPRLHTPERGARRLQPRLDTPDEAIAETRRDVSAGHADLASTRTELTGSIVEMHDELTGLQANSERNDYEFDIDKSKQFQKDGPIGIRLKKADTKHQSADVELLIGDRDLSQQHVNLYETVVFNSPDSPQPVRMVINSISKDHIHGYVNRSENTPSELASNSNASIPGTINASQASSNADAPVLQAQDRARLGLQRQYSLWKTGIAHETHRISLATLPIREALRRPLSSN